MNDHPTPEQIEAAQRERDPMPWGQRLTLAIALVASCAASVLMPWGCSAGPLP